VFAKGILEDDGFAWHVTGRVHGYATNLVATQNPAPGTRVVNTGAPTIAATLSKGRYAETGKADDDAPYVGTATQLATAVSAPASSAGGTARPPSASPSLSTAASRPSGASVTAARQSPGTPSPRLRRGRDEAPPRARYAPSDHAGATRLHTGRAADGHGDPRR